MDKDSKFTRDEDGYIAVRTVSAPYSSGTDDKDSMFTTDEDGYVAVRTINGAGSGGGDSHNKGYFATQAALEEAYPTAEAGDWAIVGATDTVWIWDEDSSAWVDSDQKGQVTSVNGKTGTVNLTATDVDAMPQYSSMPTASATNEGDIVQFTGTTDVTYTNGYFYKCVSDGQNPATYSWEAVEVQAGSGGGLPDQTGQSGKFLTTDGTDASWGNALTNTNYYYPDESISIGSSTIARGSISIGNNILLGSGYGVTIGNNISTGAGYGYEGSIAIGNDVNVNDGGHNIAIGRKSNATADGAIAIGSSDNVSWSAKSTAECAIQIGCSWRNQQNIYVNNEANTLKIGNANGNYKLLSADGTIPADRLASTTGLADGNYKLRLTMANGVPTLSWVAE